MVEGFRSLIFLTFTIFLCQASRILLCDSDSTVGTILNLLVFMLLLVNLLLVRRFKVYELPHPNGQYLVGYKEVATGGNSFYRMCVYYPAKDDSAKKCKQAKWLNTPEFWRMIHATTDKDRERPGKLPKFFFYVASQYLYKLKMGAYKDAEIIDTNELTYHSRIYALSRRLTEFPVILMSTGLASHLNGYSTIAKHLASKGIIVFCMAQNEEIRNPVVCRFASRNFRFEQLYHRFAYAEKALDLITNTKKIMELFGKEGVNLDLQHLSVMGHSFGAISSLYAALNDKRVRGVVITHDPPMFGLPDNFSFRNVLARDANAKNAHKHVDLGLPFLALNTENFYPRLYDFFQENERMQHFFHSQKQNYSQNVLIYSRKLAHANFLDHSLVSAGEFEFFGVIEKGEDPLRHTGHILLLNDLFLERHLIFQQQLATKLPDQTAFFNKFFELLLRDADSQTQRREFRFISHHDGCDFLPADESLFSETRHYRRQDASGVCSCGFA